MQGSFDGRLVLKSNIEKLYKSLYNKFAYITKHRETEELNHSEYEDGLLSLLNEHLIPFTILVALIFVGEIII